MTVLTTNNTPSPEDQLRVIGFRGSPLRIVLNSGHEATVTQKLIDAFASPSPFDQADVKPSAELRKRIMRAIFDPGATEGFKLERDLTTWQTDAVMRALAAPASEGSADE